MKKYTTVSAKIQGEEREEIKNLGLDHTEIIRKAVHEDIRNAKNKSLIEKNEQSSPCNIEIQSG